MKTFGNESRFVNLDMSLILMYKRIYTINENVYDNTESRHFV
jgi:hypothetical protein